MTATTIKLIGTTYTTDAYGVQRPADTTREIYAYVDNVSRSEFYEAGRNGLNPSYKITVFTWDYDGETMLVLDGAAYRVYRTYTDGDDIELYVERQGGANARPIPEPEEGSDDGEG